MVEFLIKLLRVTRSKLKSRARLEAENIVLRQQVIVLSRKARSRVRLRNIDWLIFVWLCPLIGESCSRFSANAEDRAHRSDTNPWRPASSIPPALGFE
jgi:hypothetical protein